MFAHNDVLKLVLADGSAIVRAGIRRLLIDVPEIEIVEECNDVKTAISAIMETQPDLVMLDFQLGSGSAVEVMQKCRTMHQRPICIVNTLQADSSTRAISYAAGADVFFDKSRDPEPLVTMLRKLACALLDNGVLAE